MKNQNRLELKLPLYGDKITMLYSGYEVTINSHCSGFIELYAMIVGISFKDAVHAKITRKTCFRESGKGSTFKIHSTFEPEVKVSNRVPSSELSSLEKLKVMKAQGEALIEITSLVEEILQNHQKELEAFFGAYDNSRKKVRTLGDVSGNRTRLTSQQIKDIIAEIKSLMRSDKFADAILSNGSTLHITKTLLGGFRYSIDDASYTEQLALRKLDVMKLSSIKLIKQAPLPPEVIEE